MTPQQAKTLTFLKTYSAERGGAMPSFDEIAEAIGIRSKSGVSRIVQSLVDRGLIRRTASKQKHRSIAIVESPDAVAAERERCAKIADDHAARCARGSATSSMAEDAWGEQAAREIAKAIRGRI